jgi:hypothetical protein
MAIGSDEAVCRVLLCTVDAWTRVQRAHLAGVSQLNLPLLLLYLRTIATAHKALVWPAHHHFTRPCPQVCHMVAWGFSTKLTASVQTANSIEIYPYLKRVDCIASILHMYICFISSFLMETRCQQKSGYWMLFHPSPRCFAIFSNLVILVI